MGGDGGVIASNRRYMRGAGVADHTADYARHEQERTLPQDGMKLCHLTKTPLFEDNKQHQIVACPYGRLYHKEAVVEALLRRKKQEEEEEEAAAAKDGLGSHIRGLKDLKNVRFQLDDGTKPVCPVTAVELSGINAAFLIPTGPGINVLSERAMKEMGVDALQEDYGPFQTDDLIRLAPPPSMMEEIQEKVQQRQSMEAANKRKKKNGKKKKRKDAKQQQDDETESKKPKKLKSSKDTVADAARRRVHSAVQSNQVLSSLFATNQNKVSAKERNDNLFARS